MQTKQKPSNKGIAVPGEVPETRMFYAAVFETTIERLADLKKVFSDLAPTRIVYQRVSPSYMTIVDAPPTNGNGGS